MLFIQLLDIWIFALFHCNQINAKILLEILNR